MLRTFSKTTRVSNFRPVVAKAVIERYSEDGESVLDFSSGYSGRLLGCMALDRSYLGIDPNRNQVRNSRKLLRTVSKFISLTSKYVIEGGCAEDVLPNLRRSSFHLIFSSPPYFNLERYSQEPTQSYIRYPRYQLWKECFLERILVASERLLRDGGYLVVNVANSGGYPIADDCFKIGRQILQHVATQSILLARKPYLKSHENGRYKPEPLFVFRKL
jgi:tRNA1(Val) A37 N6-methylase TrmN6